eukprot:Transcript_17683.p1 GENE.Transcript_17683~~Transcript_17683.p1  ORF type:complete len:577 (-),score=179.55 Transcript_17683:1263-2867(-)
MDGGGSNGAQMQERLQSLYQQVSSEAAAPGGSSAMNGNASAPLLSQGLLQMGAAPSSRLGTVNLSAHGQLPQGPLVPPVPPVQLPPQGPLVPPPAGGGAARPQGPLSGIAACSRSAPSPPAGTLRDVPAALTGRCAGSSSSFGAGPLPGVPGAALPSLGQPVSRESLAHGANPNGLRSVSTECIAGMDMIGELFQQQAKRLEVQLYQQLRDRKQIEMVNVQLQQNVQQLQQLQQQLAEEQRKREKLQAELRAAQAHRARHTEQRAQAAKEAEAVAAAERAAAEAAEQARGALAAAEERHLAREQQLLHEVAALDERCRAAEAAAADAARQRAEHADLQARCDRLQESLAAGEARVSATEQASAVLLERQAVQLAERDALAVAAARAARAQHAAERRAAHHEHLALWLGEGGASAEGSGSAGGGSPAGRGNGPAGTSGTPSVAARLAAEERHAARLGTPPCGATPQWPAEFAREAAPSSGRGNGASSGSGGALLLPPAVTEGAPAEWPQLVRKGPPRSANGSTACSLRTPPRHGA